MPWCQMSIHREHRSFVLRSQEAAGDVSAAGEDLMLLASSSRGQLCPAQARLYSCLQSHCDKYPFFSPNE